LAFFDIIIFFMKASRGFDGPKIIKINLLFPG